MTPIVWGYTFLEAPRDDGAGGLYFSDIIAGGVYHWSPDGAVTTVIPKRRGVGGLVLHADGGLVLSGRDVCHVHEGRSRQLLTVDGALGFNDLTTDAQGRVYVGSMRSGAMEVEHRVPSEVWRIDRGGATRQVCDGIAVPNGAGLAPDGRTLVPVELQRRRGAGDRYRHGRLPAARARPARQSRRPRGRRGRRRLGGA